MGVPKWIEHMHLNNEASIQPDLGRRRLILSLTIAWEALENHGHEREDDCIYHEAMRRIEKLGK